MRKYNRYKHLLLVLLSFLASLFLSLHRMVTLTPLVESLQNEFQDFNIPILLRTLIILGSFLNILFQSWVIYTLLRILKLKKTYFHALELIVHASFLGLIGSQYFLQSILINALSFSISFALLCFILYRESPLVKRLVLASYGLLLGMIQVWIF